MNNETEAPSIPAGYYRIDPPFTIQEGDMYYLPYWGWCNFVNATGETRNHSSNYTYCRHMKGYTPKQDRPLGTILPQDAQERKKHPVATGVLDYFPRTIAAIARCSYEGNAQHHPDRPLHWDRSKSTDDADAMIRHYIDRKNVEGDVPEVVKMAWRALAVCEKQLEEQE